MKVPYDEAVLCSTTNRLSKHPTRADTRLEPVASPSFESGVRLNPGDKVVTVGSCFSRNIEAFLGSIGFVVPVLGYNGLEEESRGGKIQGILNKHTAVSIHQEILWLKSVRDSGGTVTWDQIAPMAYQTPEGTWLDLQLSSTFAVSRERLLERRQAIYDIQVQMFGCDLVIITPAQIETWFDKETGLYIQQTPSEAMANGNKGRFFLEVLDFFQCYEALDSSVKILKEEAARQIAITVSPVPLARTMTSKDVIIANMYSKSTLRSVAGLLSDLHDSVSYIPSYERVMLTKKQSVWNDDLRHVVDAFVGGIVSTFSTASGHDVTSTADLLLAFDAAYTDENFKEAETIFGTIEDAISTTANGFEGISSFSFHKNACLLLEKIGRVDEALRFAAIIRKLRPNKEIGYIPEIRMRLNRLEIELAIQVAIDGLRACKNTNLKSLRKCIERRFDKQTREEIISSV